MKFLFGVCLSLGILGFCLAVDCTSKPFMQYEQRRCFEKYDLQLNGDSDNVQDAVQNDPDAVCQDRSNYKLALQCAMNIGRDCMRELGQSPDILPDGGELAKGIDYMCDNIHNLNSRCVKDQQADMKQCAVRKAYSVFSGNTNLNVAYITCKAFEIAEECVREELAECGNQTRNIMVSYTEYVTPPACGHHSPDLGVFTTIAPTTAVELVTGVPSLPYVSCYSESSIKQGQETCFEREDITVELPNLKLSGGKQAAKQSYLDALLSNSKDFHAVCRKLPQYQRGMGCAMEVARNCMPSGYKDYLPSGRQVQLMLAELCRHVDDINQECVRSKAGALFDCGYRLGSQHRTSNVKALLCNAFKFNTRCQKEVLPACGCPTTRLYVSVAKKYLNPAACSPNYESVPVCDAETMAFVDTGRATKSMAGFLAIVLAMLTSLAFM